MIINITDISKYVKLEQLTYMNTNVVELYKQLINMMMNVYLILIKKH